MADSNESKIDEIVNLLDARERYLSEELDATDMLFGKTIRRIIDDKLNDTVELDINDYLGCLDSLLECETCSSELTLIRLLRLEVEKIINPKFTKTQKN